MKKTDDFSSRDCEREVKQSLAINDITMKEEGRKERYRGQSGNKRSLA